MYKYLKDIPKTLQEDFAENKVIPFVGAGFSKNAILPQGLSIPDWNELGRQIAAYIPDYEYINAIDALSLFETQFRLHTYQMKANPIVYCEKMNMMLL